MVPLALRRPSVIGALTAPLALGALGCAGCAVVLWGDPTTPGGPLPVCPTKALLGIDCPGCGSLRMLSSLLHGNLGAAVHYNALGLLAVPLLGWAFLAWTLGRWRGGRVRSWQHARLAPILVLVAVGAWWLVRILPFAPFTALRV